MDKLGGDDEAAVAMGKMFTRIAARFATSADVKRVRPTTLGSSTWPASQ